MTTLWRRERPLLRYHGGKWVLAPWIIGFFAPHQVYVEPFGGAASVLLRKPRAPVEYYGDLDGDVVNLFAVLRSNRASDLIAAVYLTPYAAEEFHLAYQPCEEPVERARRLLVRSYMGFGSPGAMGGSTGFRASASRRHNPATDWTGMPDALAEIADRLLGVIVQRKPALQLMAEHDGEDTLIYLDPPYVQSTRGLGNPYDVKHKYRHELTDEDHVQLLTAARQCAGMVAISGYATELYRDLLTGWTEHQCAARADGNRERVECLWVNPALEARRPRRPQPQQQELLP